MNVAIFLAMFLLFVPGQESKETPAKPLPPKAGIPKPEPPKEVAQPPFVGTWVLKNVTVDDRPVGAKDMATVMKKSGGIEAEMVYRFRNVGKDDRSFCVLNELDYRYKYVPETKELIIYHVDMGDPTPLLRFTARKADKTLKLRCRDNKKRVDLTFSPEE